MKDIKDNIIKEDVIINGELMVYNTDLATINDNIDKAKKVEEVIEDIHLLKRIEGQMEFAEKQFKEKVKESLKSFNEKQKALKDTIEKFKSKAVIEAEETLVIKTKLIKKVNDDTGEVTFKKTKVTSYDLPSGLTYKRGTISYDYKEDGLDDKYFKKTIKKTLVKKDIEKGILEGNIAIPKKGKPSVSIDSLTLGAYIETKHLEKKEKENEEK